MTIQVHGIGGSAPCRIVYMTCEALGLDYETVTCDLQKGENRTPEYLKVITSNLLQVFVLMFMCKNAKSSDVQLFMKSFLK